MRALCKSSGRLSCLSTDSSEGGGAAPRRRAGCSGRDVGASQRQPGDFGTARPSAGWIQGEVGGSSRVRSAGSQPVTSPPTAPQTQRLGGRKLRGMGKRGVGRGGLPRRLAGGAERPAQRGKDQTISTCCIALFLGRKQKRVAQRFLIFRQ